MLAVIACAIGIVFILVSGELLWHEKILRGEFQRKYVHILTACFVATWPWLISFKAIQLLGVVALAAQLLNRWITLLHYNSFGDRGSTYGDVFVALAIIICALATANKTYFALAMLELGLADGLAAVVGTKFGQDWRYKVFGSTKTVIGTMTFWLVSLAIFGAGLPFAHSLNLHAYNYLLIFLPPALALLENISLAGLDNLTLPIATIAALRLLS